MLHIGRHFVGTLAGDSTVSLTLSVTTEPLRREAVYLVMTPYIALLASLASPAAAPVVGPPYVPAEHTPRLMCMQVHSPFLGGDRKDRCKLMKRMTSRFGANRTSFFKGHKHAGVDLDTRYAENVFGLCDGKVVNIHLGFPHLTVVVAHRTPAGEMFYASYKHVAQVKVKVGDAVDKYSRIGRVFSKAEQRRAGWKKNHLHFEIRRSIADKGTASWTSMTLDELKAYARDPEVFLTRHMKRCEE